MLFGEGKTSKQLLVVLDWLFDHQESVHVFTAATCAVAARMGQVECLEWLRDREVPWDWRTPRAARVARHKHILDWLKFHGGHEIEARDA